VATVVFALVVSLEQLGYGANRLGDMAAELKGNPTLLAERVAISVLVVGPVEEFIFRGFLFLRLTKLFGGSTIAVALALLLQAGIFGLSHAYQHLYGILLTTFLGIFFAVVYLALRRNLWVIIIGHGVYDAAHAIYSQAFSEIGCNKASMRIPSGSDCNEKLAVAIFLTATKHDGLKPSI
jgi:membrane protease YdiL (CAAX protease family)